MYEITQGPHPDFPDLEIVTLHSPANVTATFVPKAGMVCSSMTHDGEEMLGQRYGLAGYLETGRTFGVPILAPWANRLGKMAYAVVHEGGGVRRIDVNPETPNLRFDPYGQPIHGLLRGSSDWDIMEVGASSEEAWIMARLVFDQKRIDFAAFPFEHHIELKVTLRATLIDVQHGDHRHRSGRGPDRVRLAPVPVDPRSRTQRVGRLHPVHAPVPVGLDQAPHRDARGRRAHCREAG